MRLILNCIVAVCGCMAAAAHAQEACGQLANAYGPYDYRTEKPKLAIVEVAHFTPDVEFLRGGNTSTLGGDIDYTLRASPNHHRALNSMMNLALRLHTKKPQGAHYTLDCYFDRALRFAPNDGIVREIYGVYLSRTDRKRDAVRVLEDALQFENDDANLHYNLGLVYADLKDYPNALKHAQLAYRLGASLPGLRNKLEAAGQWRGSADKEAAAPASAGVPLPRVAQ